MPPTKQDIINFSISAISALCAIAAVIIGYVTYEDKDAINKLTAISKNQQAQLHDLDVSITLLDSQVDQVRSEIDLLKLQTNISQNQDRKLYGILKELDTQDADLTVQLSISSRTTEISNRLELFKRKSDVGRLLIIYNNLLSTEFLVKYPVETDTAKARLYFYSIRPVFNECLQNAILVENEELDNILLNLSNRLIGLNAIWGAPFDGKERYIGADHKKHTIGSVDELKEYRIKEFSDFLEEEMSFRKKFGKYVDDQLNEIRTTQKSMSSK
jgi:hypothetical protein